MGSNCCKNVPTFPTIGQETLSSDPFEDYFITDKKIDRTSLNNNYLYFWVDRNINKPQNINILKAMKPILEISGLSSVSSMLFQLKNTDAMTLCKVICAASLDDQDFQMLQNDYRIQAIYLFCQNQPKANSLMASYPKIKKAYFKFEELKQFMRNQRSAEKILSLLFFEDDEIKIINKARSNFYCLTSSKVHQIAKEQFITFAEKFYPQQMNEIDNFCSKYKLDLTRQDKNKQTLDWLSKSGFFYEAIRYLPMVTSDPKQLAHIRFPLNQAYHCIYQIHKLNRNVLQEAFIVLSVSENELNKLKNNQNNFVMFPSFVKGWSSEKKAKQAFKQRKQKEQSVFIKIMISSAPMKQELDYGYCVLDCDKKCEDVLFNIYNLFEIKQFDPETKEAVFEYGSLAQIVQLRKKSREAKMSSNQNNLIKNYHYLQDTFSKIESQAHILQMSGHFDDSCQQIRRSSTRGSEHLREKNLINLGDAYALRDSVKEAQQAYSKIQSSNMKLIANVHLADLYFRKNNTQKLQQIIEEITKNLADYQKLDKPECFKAQNYVAMDLMNKGQYKRANIQYKSLISQMNIFYDDKYEGIPLVHEINRNKAACETKLQNYDEALGLLNSTVEWQRVCEGVKSPGLIVTENLIKSLHESKGEKDLAKASEKRMKNIFLGYSKNQSLYQIRKSAVPTMNQSAINIAVTGIK